MPVTPISKHQLANAVPDAQAATLSSSTSDICPPMESPSEGLPAAEFFESVPNRQWNLQKKQSLDPQQMTAILKQVREMHQQSKHILDMLCLDFGGSSSGLFQYLTLKPPVNLR